MDENEMKEALDIATPIIKDIIERDEHNYDTNKLERYVSIVDKEDDRPKSEDCDIYGHGECDCGEFCEFGRSKLD